MAVQRVYLEIFDPRQELNSSIALANKGLLGMFEELDGTTVERVQIASRSSTPTSPSEILRTLAQYDISNAVPVLYNYNVLLCNIDGKHEGNLQTLIQLITDKKNEVSITEMPEVVVYRANDCIAFRANIREAVFNELGKKFDGVEGSSQVSLVVNPSRYN